MIRHHLLEKLYYIELRFSHHHHLAIRQITNTSIANSIANSVIVMPVNITMAASHIKVAIPQNRIMIHAIASSRIFIVFFTSVSFLFTFPPPGVAVGIRPGKHVDVFLMI